uniref:hypothetical protein n=1 Tax=Gemmiger formicilis TaxID=745368 RepID=UPI003FEE8D25
RWRSAQKNVGADSISARARLRQGKLPRAHIECAPTDFVFDQREKTPHSLLFILSYLKRTLS